MCYGLVYNNLIIFFYLYPVYVIQVCPKSICNGMFIVIKSDILVYNKKI